MALADVHVAPTVDHMVGWIRGSGPDYGPAEWIAGVPGSLISKTTIPPEIQIGFFIGITSDGVLVAKNQLSDGLSAGIVGLFPVS